MFCFDRLGWTPGGILVLGDDAGFAQRRNPVHATHAERVGNHEPAAAARWLGVIVHTQFRQVDHDSFTLRPGQDVAVRNHHPVAVFGQPAVDFWVGQQDLVLADVVLAGDVEQCVLPAGFGVLDLSDHVHIIGRQLKGGG